MNQDSFETQSKAIFSRLPQVEPSPYLAGRVVAHLGKKPSREVWILRWVAALSVAAVIGLTTYIQIKPSQDLLFTYEPYVIQVDFNSQELKMVQSAEITLPDGVSFVSKNEAVKSLRSMRLPVSGRKDGKLPFVLVSERSGELPVEVRMYGENDELIQTKTLTLHFGKKG